MLMLVEVSEMHAANGQPRSIQLCYELTGRLDRALSDERLAQLMSDELHARGVVKVDRVGRLRLRDSGHSEVVVNGRSDATFAQVEWEAERVASGFRILMPYCHSRTNRSAKWLSERARRKIVSKPLQEFMTHWLRVWIDSIKDDLEGLVSLQERAAAEREIRRAMDRLATLDGCWSRTTSQMG